MKSKLGVGFTRIYSDLLGFTRICSEGFAGGNGGPPSDGVMGGRVDARRRRVSGPWSVFSKSLDLVGAEMARLGRLVRFAVFIGVLSFVVRRI